MAYNYQLSEEAEADIYESYVWYESQQLMLGEKFLDSLDSAKQAIISTSNLSDTLQQESKRLCSEGFSLFGFIHNQRK